MPIYRVVIQREAQLLVEADGEEDARQIGLAESGPYEWDEYVFSNEEPFDSVFRPDGKSLAAYLLKDQGIETKNGWKSKREYVDELEEWDEVLQETKDFGPGPKQDPLPLTEVLSHYGEDWDDS